MAGAQANARLVLCGQELAVLSQGKRFLYAVQLTTYFLPTSADDDSDPKDKAWRYKQYCDRIPGTGKVVFTVEYLMEQRRERPMRGAFVLA